MCAQFLIKAKIKDLIRESGLNITGYDEDLFDLLVVPRGAPAPVLILGSVKQMSYALLPYWSKERKIKFSTHNARLFSEDKKDVIYNKATWKTPFAKRHCIVPVSQFIEPIYTGEFSGNMVKFGSTKDEMLFAAGIWDTWIDKQSGEVLDSFAIITNDPPKFVEETGHDRCPIFLEGTALEAWLHSESKSPQDWVEFLKKESSEVELKASVFRPMAKGWEKRA